MLRASRDQTFAMIEPSVSRVRSPDAGRLVGVIEFNYEWNASSARVPTDRRLQ